jgi:hypothetical protein
MRQSSIEWFISEFEKQIQFRPNSELDIWFKELFPKAKAMHKMEIENAYLDGDSNGCGCYDYSTEQDAEEYYNSKNYIKDGAEQN